MLHGNSYLAKFLPADVHSFCWCPHMTFLFHCMMTDTAMVLIILVLKTVCSPPFPHWHATFSLTNCEWPWPLTTCLGWGNLPFAQINSMNWSSLVLCCFANPLSLVDSLLWQSMWQLHELLWQVQNNPQRQQECKQLKSHFLERFGCRPENLAGQGLGQDNKCLWKGQFLLDCIGASFFLSRTVQWQHNCHWQQQQHAATKHVWAILTLKPSNSRNG